MWTVLDDDDPFVDKAGVAQRYHLRAALLVRCECGTERRVRLQSLEMGKSRSCGCVRLKNLQRGGKIKSRGREK